jgi:hypothetical protein
MSVIVQLQLRSEVNIVKWSGIDLHVLYCRMNMYISLTCTSAVAVLLGGCFHVCTVLLMNDF